MSKVPKPLTNLYFASNLLYIMSNVSCLAIDLNDKKLIEIPKGHLENCFCKVISNITGLDVNFDHIYKKCELPTNINSQIIYKCPFGLSNIIVPVFDGNKLIAALQAGPILTQNPEEFLKENVFPFWNFCESAIRDLREELRTYPSGDINYVVALSEVMAALITCQTPALTHNSNIDMDLEKDLSEYKGCSKLIGSILSFISTNYAEGITLNDAAKHAYVNPSHLSRVFNRNMNCHFRSYLNSVRIEKAKELLKYTNMNIAEICNQVGYTDQSYFDKIFKKTENLTPRQYKKNHTNNKDTK